LLTNYHPMVSNGHATEDFRRSVFYKFVGTESGQKRR
jgi:hypothetical protein